MKKGNDHLVDVAQYLCSRWVLRRKGEDMPDERTPAQEWADEVRAAIRKQLGQRQPPAAGVVV